MRYQRLLFLVGLLTLAGCLNPRLARAITDPLAVPNNLTGIHIQDTNDIAQAVSLVNGTEGSYGYLTIVITQNDRSIEKWQGIMDDLREKKLIPIIRLATVPDNSGWQKPLAEQADDWADFLNKLNWVTVNRYVVLFNEPNHSSEWGGTIDPVEYVRIYRAYESALKQASSDFYILPAGFDLAAVKTATTMEVTEYWRQMHMTDPDLFKSFTGWTSHSYPNPNFTAPAIKTGRLSLLGYRWEMHYCARFGLANDLPIFITETGWDVNNLEKVWGNKVESKIFDYWQSAFSSVWRDSNLVAITPFILHYPQAPFSGFSFTDHERRPLTAFDAVSKLKKIKGEPKIYDSGRISLEMSSEITAESKYAFYLDVSNEGQAIWDEQYNWLIESSPKIERLELVPAAPLKPGSSQKIRVRLETGVATGDYVFRASLMKKGSVVTESEPLTVRVAPLPELDFQVSLGWKKRADDSVLTLLIYDEKRLVKKIESIKLIDGRAKILKLNDLVLHRPYRFVITKPYYLPRQKIAVLEPELTQISFKRLLPLDILPDGKLTFKDALTAFIMPKLWINLWWPF